jgi:hypothetical protein
MSSASVVLIFYLPRVILRLSTLGLDWPIDATSYFDLMVRHR